MIRTVVYFLQKSQKGLQRGSLLPASHRLEDKDMKNILYIMVVLFVWTGGVWGQRQIETVVQEPNIEIIVEHVSCDGIKNGEADGKIIVTISNQLNAPYRVTILGNNGYVNGYTQNTNVFVFDNNIDATTYFISAFYSSNTLIGVYFVDVYKLLELTEDSSKPPTATNGNCENEMGKITAKFNGGGFGSVSYRYKLSSANANNGTFLTIDDISSDSELVLPNLPNGTYTLEIFDTYELECNPSPYTSFYKMYPPFEITATPLNVQQKGDGEAPKCMDGEDGKATITLTGGIAGNVSVNAPYTVISPALYDGFYGEFTIEGLPEGERTLLITIVDDAESCQKFFDVVVPDAPETAPTATIIVTEHPCPGESNGSFVIQGFGGTPGSGTPFSGYEFTIMPGNIVMSGTQVNVTSLSHGEYTVTGEDGNGCPVAITGSPVTLTNKAPSTFTALQGEQITCADGSNATIIITNTSSYPDAQIQYKLEKKEGSVSTPVEGYEDFTTLDVFSGLSDGTYIITGKANGCEWTHDEITIREPDPVIVIPTFLANPPTCNNGNDGSITGLDATGGRDAEGEDEKTYWFSIVSFDGNIWSDNWEKTFTGLFSGTYIVKAKDENECETPEALYQEITMPNPPAVTFTAQFETLNECAGYSNATIKITGTSYPNPSYTDVYMKYKLEKYDEAETDFVPVDGYDEWVTMAVGDEFTGLKDGKYRISGINDKDCPIPPYTVEVEFTDPNAIVVNIVESTSILDLMCYGNTNGRINLSGSGASSGRYQYMIGHDEDFTGNIWHNNNTNHSDFNSLPAGTYWVKARERIGGRNPGFGCESEPKQVVIREPEELTVAFSGKTKATCDNTTDGTITLSVAGGTYPGVPPNENTYIYSLYRVSPPPSGVINILPDNTVVSNPVFTVGQGIYNISVQYNSACSAKSADGIEVEHGKNITASIIQNPDPVTCHTEAGNISLTATDIESEDGWDVEYYYMKNGNGLWINNPDHEFSGLDGGVYDIRLKYAKDELDNCPFDKSVTIIIPDPINITTDVTNEISCNNVNDGEITVTVSGGYKPPVLSTILAKYQFRISDEENGIHDEGVDDGWKDANEGNNKYKFGGLSPEVEYTFEVRILYSTDGETTWIETCPGLTYPYTNETLVNPAQLTIYEDAHLDILCPNEVDPQTGSFRVVAGGGTPDSPNEYTYTLFKYNFTTVVDAFEPAGIVNSTGAFEQLDSGKYMVRATDKNNCPVESNPIIITRPEKIEFTLDVGLDIENCNPIATLEIKIDDELFSKHSFVYRFTESTEPFQSNEEGWTDFGNTNPLIISGVYPESIYIVQLAYAGISCTVFDEKTKSTLELPELKIEISNEIENECFGNADAEFTFTSTLPAGTVYSLFYKFDDSFQWVVQTTYNIVAPLVPFRVSNLYNGFYKISTIVNGCLYESEEIDLSKPYIIGLDPDKPPQLLNPCDDSSRDGEIQIWIIGGTPDYKYNLHTKTTHPVTGAISYPQVSGQQDKTDGKFTNLPAGTYFVRIIDKYGCDSPYLPLAPDGSPEGITLGPAAQLTIGVEDEDIDLTHIYCTDEKGSATVSADGGKPVVIDIVDDKPVYGYNYTWQEWDEVGQQFVGFFPTTAITAKSCTATGLGIGKYKVIVNDDCNKTGENVYVEFEIKDLSLAVNLIEKGYIECPGDNPAGGFIIVTTTGGISKEDSESLYDYFVEFSDDNGSTWTNFADNYSENVIITKVDDAEETFEIYGLPAGKYNITVIDKNDCNVILDKDYDEDVVEIVASEAFNPQISWKDPNCFGEEGEFTLIITGGTPGYKLTIKEGNNPVDIFKDGETDPFDQNSTLSASVVYSFKIPMDEIESDETRNFTITIEDSGCGSETITFSLTNAEELTITSAGRLLGQTGANSWLETVYLCDELVKGQLRVRGDMPPENEIVLYKYVIDGWYETTLSLSEGSVTYLVEDAGKYKVEMLYNKENGVFLCSVESNEVEFIQYESMQIIKIDETPQSCNTSGSLDIEVTGGKVGYPDNEYSYEIVKDGATEPIITGTFTGNTHTIDNNLYEGNYSITVSLVREAGVCPALMPVSDNFTIELADNPIDFNKQKWFEDPIDPSCFNVADGKIVFLNPPIWTVNNGIYSINDPVDGKFAYTLTYTNNDGTEEQWDWTTSEWIDVEELKNLKIGAYTLEIKEKLDGVNEEEWCSNSTTMTLGEDLPRVEIDNFSFVFNCVTETGILEFDVEFSADMSGNTFVVACTKTDDPPVPIEEIIPDKKWRYRAEVIAEGKATITVTGFGAASCVFEHETEEEYHFPQSVTLDVQIKGLSETVDCETIVSREVTFVIDGDITDYELWVNGVARSFNTVYNLNKGDYTATVKDKTTGCIEASKDFEILLPEPVDMESIKASAVISDETCAGKCDGLIELPAGYQYLWDNALTGNVRRSLMKGDYSVTIRNSNGVCPVTSTFTVGVANTVTIGFSPDKVYCLGSEVNLFGDIVVDGKNVIDLKAEWKLPDGSAKDWAGDWVPLIYSATDETVSLTATIEVQKSSSKVTCEFTEEFNAKIGESRELFIKDEKIYIPEGELYPLNLDGSDWIDDYKWVSDPPGYKTENLNPSSPPIMLPSPGMAGPYTLTLTAWDKDGCEASVEFEVGLATGFFIPNVFTPNDDGEHDTWKFRNIEKYLQFYDIQVSVSTRTGIPVYEAKGYNNSSVVWDGRRNGNDLPIGTYYYVVKLVPNSSSQSKTQIITGSVTIVR